MDMEIGATKAVQERLKTTKISELKDTSLVLCWDTYLAKIKGKKCSLYCKCRQSLYNCNDRH